MPLAEKGVRGKGRQPLSPPQHTVTPEREQRYGTEVGRLSTHADLPLPSIALENVNSHRQGKTNLAVAS